MAALAGESLQNIKLHVHCTCTCMCTCTCTCICSIFKTVIKCCTCTCIFHSDKYE